MHYYTYVLRCVNSNTNRSIFYVGSTTNIQERLVQHQNKNTKTTKQFDKIELVYYETCLNKTDALKREKQLKTGFGRGYIKKRIGSYLNSLRE